MCRCEGSCSQHIILAIDKNILIILAQNGKMSQWGNPARTYKFHMSQRRTYLILDQQLDTLDGSSCGLRDSGRDTTHCYRTLASKSPQEIVPIHPCVNSEGRNVDDSDRICVVRVDILKKSITNGGLSNKCQRRVQGDCRNWENFWSRGHWAPTKLAARR